MNATALHVLIVVFVATLFRSAFGFGEALIAVPLLTLFIDLKVAAPVAVLVSITIAAVVVLRYKRPDAERLYRTPGYPLVPAIYVLGASTVVLCLFIRPDVVAIVGSRQDAAPCRRLPDRRRTDAARPQNHGAGQSEVHRAR